MTLREFEQLVTNALETLPESFSRHLDNVEIVVEVWPTADQLRLSGTGRQAMLYGLYQGIPKTRRGTYQWVVPDKISIFAGPLVASYGHDPDLLTAQVRDTVLHEIGHHFGMSEEEIRKAGK